MMALELAALDLVSARQIRFCAEGAGIELPSTDDRKVLIEVLRRELLR